MTVDTLIPETDEAMKKAVEYTLHEFSSIQYENGYTVCEDCIESEQK